MNIFRIGIICGELFLIGLNTKLMFFSYSKRHYDALLAEISYSLFVLYSAWIQKNHLEAGLTWGMGLTALAAILGIVGLLGICKQLMDTGSYTNGKMVSNIVNHTPVIRRIMS